MPRQTPLNATHRAAGARMVDFGGWDMPVNYGSQIDEHNAVRNDAGMFDVSHMRVVDLEGGPRNESVRDFLRYALANNVDKLKDPGKALYSCLLNRDGTVIDDLIAYFLREDFFRLVVNAGTADKDIAWFRQLLDDRGSQIVLTPRTDLAMIAVQGPNARAKLWRALPGSEQVSAGLKPFTAASASTPLGDAFIARTGYTGEDGFEVMISGSRAVDLWQALAAAGVRPAGLGARDTLRLEAGMNLYGQDMDETRVAARIGARVDGGSREPARLRRQGGAGRASAVAAAHRAPARRQGRRAARAPDRAHRSRRRRDHERHLQSDARSVDCARPPARRGRRRRHACKSSSGTASSPRGS